VTDCDDEAAPHLPFTDLISNKIINHSNGINNSDYGLSNDGNIENGDGGELF
jgi:hypothetical protein